MILRKSTLKTRPRAEVPLLGREAEKERLARAVRSGMFPHALLITGPAGVGKARLAGWIGAAILCPKDNGAACGQCPDCTLAARLEHPDIRWFAPHAAPGSGTLERQCESVDAQLAEMLEEWRADALHSRTSAGVSYYIATIHRLRTEASRRPVLGIRRIFVITDAEALVVNEDAAAPAANALLKLLEEPPSGTYFVLTSKTPHRLPRTIRSRCATLRLAPLQESEVRLILEQAGIEPSQAAEAAKYARGSPGLARRWLDPAYQTLRDTALHVLLSISSPIRRYARIRETELSGARGDFSALLGEIEVLALQAASFAGGDAMNAVDPRAVELIQNIGGDGTAWAEVARAAVLAQERTRGNAVPALVLHDLLAFAERRLKQAHRSPRPFPAAP